MHYTVYDLLSLCWWEASVKTKGRMIWIKDINLDPDPEN